MVVINEKCLLRHEKLNETHNNRFNEKFSSIVVSLFLKAAHSTEICLLLPVSLNESGKPDTIAASELNESITDYA